MLPKGDAADEDMEGVTRVPGAEVGEELVAMFPKIRGDSQPDASMIGTLMSVVHQEKFIDQTVFSHAVDLVPICDALRSHVIDKLTKQGRQPGTAPKAEDQKKNKPDKTHDKDDEQIGEI